MTINRYLFVCFFLFCFFSLAFRLLLPFGGEPDFAYRVSRILDSESGVYYFFKSFFDGYNWYPSCDISYTMQSITGTISSFDCGESLFLKITRWLLQLLFFLAFVVLFFFTLVFSKYKFGHDLFLKERFYAVFLALFFPGLIYYSGVASPEIFVLFLSLLFFIFIKYHVISFLTIYLALQVEVGGAILLVSFFCFFHFFDMLSKKASLLIVELACVSVICFFFIVKMSFLVFFFDIPVFGEKISIIHYAYTMTHSADVVAKYPLIIRPIITFMTATFMTTDGIKALVLYPIVFVFILALAIDIRRRAYNGVDVSNYAAFLAVVAFTLSTVFVLPGYSNAKYYVFCLPFLFLSALQIYSFKKVAVFNFFCSNIVIFQLIVSRA